MKKIIYIITFFMTLNTLTNNVLKQLDLSMIETNSLVCIGLDPDITKIPDEIDNLNLNDEDKIFHFLKEVIDITANYCCCYKLQKAFYDQFNNGHDLLKKTIEYIHKNYSNKPVFVDCKIGDTDNTMKAYMNLIFDKMKADGVVINPYMGDDVLEPFMKDPNKVGIILIQTSNPNAKVIQDLKLANGKKLWEEMLQITMDHWNKNNNLIIVLSSNCDEYNYSLIRSRIPNDVPILLAGIGMQGGNPQVLKQLLNKNNRGVFVNSSRGILFPYDKSDKDWRNKILSATLELKNLLNDIRYKKKKSKFLLLFGPSGSGKSTIINHLKNFDKKFKYVTPFTTRELRNGETDKIHIDEKELNKLQNEGKLLTINKIYDIYYATPKDIIDNSLEANEYPILDWPIDKLEIMQKNYGDRIFKVYIEPDNIIELQRRLDLDNRDKDGKRLQAGKIEIENLLAGNYDQMIDLRLVNKKENSLNIAKEIYNHFLESMQ